MRVTNALLPLLRRSASPRIVNMSSTVGSLARQTAADGSTGPISGAYSPSKTFLNAVTVQYAKELADADILINVACPAMYNRPQRVPRLPQPRARRPDRDSARHPARQRPHRWLLRRRRADPLVKHAA